MRTYRFSKTEYKNHLVEQGCTPEEIPSIIEIAFSRRKNMKKKVKKWNITNTI